MSDDEDAVREAEAWVVEHLDAGLRRQSPSILDIAQVACHPSQDVVACTLLVQRSFAEQARRRVGLVSLTTGAVELLELPFAQSAAPAWSPDGRLALVGMREDGPSPAVVLDTADGSWSVTATSDVPGMVETCEWSPDGSRLALQVAMPGAEISDVYGSGVVAGGGASWRPRVLPGSPGRRVAFVWDPAEGTSRAVTDLNVWELAWAGDGALVALTSQDADEGAWYDARLTRLELGSGSHRTLHEPDHQLAQPRCSPDGTSWSVLSGVQSDRGLPAGTLVVARGAAEPVEVETDGVHVADHRWLDATAVLLAGLRGLDTVVAVLDVPTGRVRTVWCGPQTSGEYQPEVSGTDGRPPVLVLEDHDTAPTLGVLGDDGFRAVLSTDCEGTRFQASRAGTTSRLSWTSVDGLEIQGLLTLPDGPGPHALVLHVHGGPTHAWRSTWSGRDPHTATLVARGYAVLRPNPRGSSGRGAGFAAAVQGDMGGLDVDDVVSGVQHLVDAGVADPARLGVTGISYGGFMACWVPCRSELFAAAVARSPATDWLTQHLTSNIAEFDHRFVAGDLFDPASPYGARSPLRHHERIRTPMLLTAGLQDLATPASQAQVLYTALREDGVETQLALYPEEGHGVRHLPALADQLARTIVWFERFMPARPGAVAGQPITDAGAPSGT